MSKSTNMLSILWLLREGKRMTASQLAAQLEIHIRTVYRCIDSLCASGVPIVSESGPNGGYRILERFVTTPLVFDMEEQKALIQAAAFVGEAGYPSREALNRAVDKLKRYANEQQLQTLQRHMDNVSTIYTPALEQQQKLLRLLEEAAATGCTLRMRYDKGKGETPLVRLFDPYGIVYWKGAWYTVGFCGLREQLRSFRTDRIVSLEKTERRFERPSSFSAKDHLMRELLPNPLDHESLITLKIRAPRNVLNLLSQHWLFGHAIVASDGELAEYRIARDALLTYVPYYLLPYGKSLTIVEPVILIDKLAAVSGELLHHYSSMRETHREP